MWEEAVRQSRIWARRYARQEEAEDVAQEALLRAWRSRDTLRRCEDFGAWLAMIVRNEAARDHARMRPEPSVLVDYEIAIEDDELARVLDRAEMERAFAMLAPHERHLLHLRYGDDMTQPAIAALLEIPEGTVKVQLHRARVKLKRAMEA